MCDNRLKNGKGITLIALVVTIIILLILAGVAINMATGDNGLFRKSKESVNIWKSAEENEQAILDSAVGYIDQEMNGQNLDDFKDYMLIACDNEGISINEVNFEQKLNLMFDVSNIITNLLSDEINEKARTATNEELLVFDYNRNPKKYVSSEITDSKSRQVVQHITGTNMQISSFEEFINKQISLGKITEEYTTVHDYYIGIGKTEEETQTEIDELGKLRVIYSQLDVVRTQSSITLPNNQTFTGVTQISYLIPYEKKEYNFIIKTTRKTCNIKIRIGDYTAIGIINRDETSSSRDDDVSVEESIQSSSRMMVQHNMIATGFPIVTDVYLLDIGNKKLLNIDEAKVNIDYSLINGTNDNEILNVPSNIIVDKGEYSEIDYTELNKQIQELLNGKGIVMYETIIDIEFVSGQIRQTSKFYISPQVQQNMLPQNPVQNLIELEYN